MSEHDKCIVTSNLSWLHAQGYVYGVASQKRYIGQVHRFGALVHRIECTSAPNLVQKCTELGAPSALNSVH